MMEILVRASSPEDFLITENITRETFWNLYHPGCVEHLILHQVRKSKSYISELDLVAVFENEIIGHIVSSKAKVVDSSGREHEILLAGPLSVLASFQQLGIGSKLMNHSITVAKELGFSGMILFGNPGFYHRFGFRNAQDYGITTKDGLNFEPFMALELHPMGLDHVKGRFFEDQAFDVQPDDLTEFEKQFPYKEKLVTDTQLQH